MRASLFCFLPEGKINEFIAALCVSHPEIDAGILVFCVAHIGGQHGQCPLCGLSPLFDLYQGIDCERMPKGMWCGLAEVHIADHFSFLIKIELFEGLSKEISDLLNI